MEEMGTANSGLVSGVVLASLGFVYEWGIDRRNGTCLHCCGCCSDLERAEVEVIWEAVSDTL